MKKEKIAENKKGSRKQKKQWAVILSMALCIGTLCMAVPVYADAEAERTRSHAVEGMEPVTVLTTQRCSIWSAPATAEENRVKYVDEGYQITVYPEVIQSGSGDGKTFYRTAKGAYVLCKCVTEAEDRAPGADATGGLAPAMPVMPALPVFDNTANVVVWKQGGSVEGSRRMVGYDTAGNVIREEIYLPEYGNNPFEIVVHEHEAEGRWEKTLYYNYWSVNTGHSLSPVERYLDFEEYDAGGNLIRSIRFNADTGRADGEYVYENTAAGRRQIRATHYSDYDGSIFQDEYDYDAAGNRIIEKRTNYRADGTMADCTIREYNAAGHSTGTQTVFYYQDGTTVREYWISDFNEKGVQTKLTIYDGNGTVIEYSVQKTDAQGNGVGWFTTYNADGTVKK